MGFGHSRLRSQACGAGNVKQNKPVGRYQTDANKTRPHANVGMGGRSHQVGGGKDPTRITAGAGKVLVKG